MSPAKRIVLILIFVALLSTPFLLRKARAPQPVKEGEAGVSEAIHRYGFALTDASATAGITFKHEGPNQIDPQLNNIKLLISSMGASVSIVDFDKDGLPDIYVCNSAEGSKNALYKNLGNGKFKDVAEEVGLADLNRLPDGCCMGAVWGDYDNDGYEDVLIYRWGKPELFHNDGGKKFTRVTEGAGLPAHVNANNALWLDYDRDGKLDLLICGYYPENIDLWKLTTTKMMPDSFEYAKNGGRKYLLHNLGNGKFEDVTEKMGLTSTRWALAAIAADIRGTGYPDIFIANDYGVSELFANQEGKGFKEIGRDCGVGYQPKSGMNASIGDVLNTGKFAVYVSNISEPGNLMQGNNLWVPKEGTSGNGIKFENLANALGVEIGGWSFGGQFGDLNNDGNLDLYLANGNISAERSTSYWYDYSKIAGGNAAIIGDAKNWPDMKGRSLSGFQQKCLWVNDGAGKFTEVAPLVGVKDTFDGRSVALADLENRGVLDVLVANQKGPLLLYHNTVDPANKWIEFDLEGTTSNRSAIGAQVRVFWSGKQQLQEVLGGSGFCAQNMRRLHFGLGKDPKIEKVEVRWPSGKTQKVDNPQIGTIIKVKEPV